MEQEKAKLLEKYLLTRRTRAYQSRLEKDEQDGW